MEIISLSSNLWTDSENKTAGEEASVENCQSISLTVVSRFRN